MILENKTNLADELLKALVYHAAKIVGPTRTGRLVVQVAWGARVHGIAWPRTRYYRNKRMKWVPVDGRMKLWLKRPTKWDDGLVIAMEIYSMAAHEARHVLDGQRNKPFDSHRKHWANRIQEKRAMRSADRAERMMFRRAGCQDTILALGIVLERMIEKKKGEYR